MARAFKHKAVKSVKTAWIRQGIIGGETFEDIVNEEREEHDEYVLYLSPEEAAALHAGDFLAPPWGRIHTALQKAMPGEDEKPKEARIQIDRAMYRVAADEELTVDQLRRLPSPPIGPDRDLFEVIPGQADRKINNDEYVGIFNGKRFFTAPAYING